MSEFTQVMQVSDNAYTVCEHTTRRVLAGDAEAARGRLVYALESLGYSVVSENPLQARRGRLKDIIRADFTEHPRKLAVGLRRGGASATQVTFDFAVTHSGWMTSGDLLTLEREADAIAALASAPAAARSCRSCGTENGPDARFCRQCGAPNAAGAPAEVEVLRLTAGARAGLQEVASGLFMALLTAAAMLPLILYGKPGAVRAGWILLCIGEAIGWWMMLYGVMRIHRTLNRKAEGQTPAAAPASATLPHAQVSALPPHANFSVTEGTTELLGANPREREPVAARREQGDTSPIG